MKFTKMQGLGNDYVYINCFEEIIDNPHKLALEISDRHFGAGSDGLVLILPGEDESDFTMRMFNADGSEAEMCGNAIRCIGKFAYDRGLTNKKTISINTMSGVKHLDLSISDGIVKNVTVDMGKPVLDPEKIPVIIGENPVVGQRIRALDKEFEFTAVSMGNPHAVIFVDKVEDFPVHKYGPVLETCAVFPQKTNVEFVQIIDRNTINMRVWERGTGETLACGTGACASAVASILNGFCDREITVRLKGGELKIKWDDKTDHVLMTGPAEFSYDGIWLK